MECWDGGNVIYIVVKNGDGVGDVTVMVKEEL